MMAGSASSCYIHSFIQDVVRREVLTTHVEVSMAGRRVQEAVMAASGSFVRTRSRVVG